MEKFHQIEITSHNIQKTGMRFHLIKTENEKAKSCYHFTPYVCRKIMRK
jgi:hypothetical protein